MKSQMSQRKKDQTLIINMYETEGFEENKRDAIKFED